MPRYKLTIEYCGTGLHGWQRQPTGPTVQSALEEAFQRLTGLKLIIIGAGRTDSGVHATGQVAHIDLPRHYRAHEIRSAVNFHLRPLPISILEAELVDDGFSARFSATGRMYLYRILNRRAPPAIDAGRIWHVPVPLDAETMADAGRLLIGHHDFTSFRAAECQALSAMKTLDRLEINRFGDEIHVITAARSFLHHQVRNMVGTLKLVGTGKWQPEAVETVLAARNRATAGPTAPPDGLYLTGVSYEKQTSTDGDGNGVDQMVEDEIDEHE